MQGQRVRASSDKDASSGHAALRQIVLSVAIVEFSLGPRGVSLTKHPIEAKTHGDLRREGSQKIAMAVNRSKEKPLSWRRSCGMGYVFTQSLSGKRMRTSTW